MSDSAPRDTSMPARDGPDPGGGSSSACYANLLRMLLPRATLIALYDCAGVALWSTAQGQDTAALDELVCRRAAELAACASNDGDMRACVTELGDADFAHLSPLHDPDEGLMGLLAIVMPNAAGRPDLCSFVQGLIQPVLQCLTRDLHFQRRVSELEKTNAAPLRDLELLANLAEHQALEPDPAAALAELAERCLEHFSAVMCAIVVPGKGLEISRNRLQHSGLSARILARTQRSLLAMAQLHGKPFIANRLPGTGGSANHQTRLPFKILSCPIHDRHNAVQGIMAVFNTPDAADFEDRHTHILSLLARRTAAVLLARYDELTGALTRSAFSKSVSQALDGAGPHSVLYVNVDRMHVVNDRFGHEAGDEVLLRIAELARQLLRPRDQLCRLPGDQFAMFLAGCDLAQARDIGEKLLHAATQLSFLRDGETVHLSLSIGAALLPASKQPLEEALAAADVACRTAKEHGRGRVECYQEDDQSIIRRHTDIAVLAQLDHALAHNEFVLYAQPLQCTRNGRLHGFEILLRLRDGNGETLAPDRFLSAAERYNLMPAIDRWVLDAALQRLAAAQTLQQQSGLTAFINLSGQSLGEAGFADFMLERIEHYGVPPQRVCFEVTESAAIAKLTMATELMRRLGERGCQFALDDFGTGLSSFAYLQALPVNLVKIDGGFVRQLARDRASTSVITAIVQVARGMKLRTVAECVENELINDRVRALGVDYSQGFLIGRPQPLTTLLGQLRGESAPAPPRPAQAGVG